jgi:hypothetical protein
VPSARLARSPPPDDLRIAADEFFAMQVVEQERDAYDRELIKQK